MSNTWRFNKSRAHFNCASTKVQCFKITEVLLYHLKDKALVSPETPYCRKSNVPLSETKLLCLPTHCAFVSPLSLTAAGIEWLSEHACNIIKWQTQKIKKLVPIIRKVRRAGGLPKQKIGHCLALNTETSQQRRQCKSLRVKDSGDYLKELSTVPGNI